MRNLVEAYGYIVIAFISCSVIFLCGFAQFNKTIKEQNNYNKNMLVDNEDRLNVSKAPVFNNCPDDEMYLTISSEILYNWEFFTKDINITDYKGEDITDKISLSLFKIVSDKETNNSSKYIYLGNVNNTSTNCLLSLDNYNVTSENEVIITDYVDNSLFKNIGYNTYINSGLDTNISNKYKVVYSVIDDKGYKAEYSIICIVENKDIMNVRNINIHTPNVSYDYNSLTDVVSNVELIKNDTYATISDNTNNIIENVICDYNIIIIDSFTMTETVIENVDDINNISNSSIIRIIITANDNTNGNTTNKVIDLYYSP